MNGPGEAREADAGYFLEEVRRQLIEKYGFTEEEAEFFDLHITSDEVHGERGYHFDQA